MQNKFIVIEGMDGSGKSTLVHALKKKLGDTCDIFREPTSQSPCAVEIREILSGKKSEKESILRQLFIQDRLWDIEHNLMPSAKKSQITILDRYYFSTAAYQGKDKNDVKAIIDDYIKNPKILQPDMVFYLQIPLNVALSRIQARNEKIEIFEQSSRLKKINDNYECIFSNSFVKNTFSFPVHILDAMAKPEEILQEILDRTVPAI